MPGTPSTAFPKDTTTMPTQKWTCEKCGTSFDSFQDASDCERSHKSESKGYRVSSPGHMAKPGASECRSVYLTHESKQEAPQWGCHINVSDSNEREPYPEWVKPLLSSSSWGDRGLVVWDESIRTVARMRAADALELLADLQTHAIEGEIIVGSRRTVYSGHQLGKKTPYILVNKISLDADRASELLRFLLANEALLQKMATKDKERWDEAIRQGYKILLQAYLRIDAEKSVEPQS